jgi:hypothetical protein
VHDPDGFRSCRRQIRLVVPLMAATLLFAACGRLGYDERTRAPADRPDAGREPAPDEDAGDP